MLPVFLCLVLFSPGPLRRPQQLTLYTLRCAVLLLPVLFVLFRAVRLPRRLRRPLRRPLRFKLSRQK